MKPTTSQCHQPAAFIGVDGLLSRLEGVKRTGQSRWIAKCPTRNERSASLNIREADNGSILLHDFGGSEFVEIIDALGLRPIELIPEHLRHARNTPHSHKPAPPIPYRDAFEAIDLAANTVLIFASLLRQRAALNDMAYEQLEQAVSRIENARAACQGGTK